MAAITETGPGSPSVDAKLFPGLKGKGLALATLGAAVAGSYLVTEKLNQPAPAPEPQVGMDDPTLADQPRFEREPVNTEQTA
jgi:putative oxidoreductase